jgi:hypothetical protein
MLAQLAARTGGLLLILCLRGISIMLALKRANWRQRTQTNFRHLAAKTRQ